MNWLAHLVLSKPSSAFRIGNLLPDILPWNALQEVPEKFQGGIECHRLIDGFADAHPVFRQSVRRIEAPFRRYGGILIDVFYDHFLACSWSEHSAQSLEEFLAEFYSSFSGHRAELPELAYTRLTQIQEGNFLSSYQDLSGVRLALQRIGSRLRKPFALGEATLALESNYEDLHRDFQAFFPELTAHVKDKMKGRE